MKRTAGLLTLLASFACLAAEPDASLAPMRSVIEHFSSDLVALERRYDVAASRSRADRLRGLLADGARELKSAVKWDALDRAGQIDYLLLQNHLAYEQKRLGSRQKQFDEVHAWLPFADAIIELAELRGHGERPDAEECGRRLTQIEAAANTARLALSNATTKPTDVLAVRTADQTDALRATLRDWNHFYSSYDPEFTWWAHEAYPKADKALASYAAFLREKFAGYSPAMAASVGHRRGETPVEATTEEEPVIGDPIGRAALLDALAAEMIPYTPEELIDVAEREWAWCDVEMKKAARDLGCGDDWHKALDKVAAIHVPPGEQPKLIMRLADEATRFVEERDLVTVPPLCKESWRIEMMSPERQKVSPYFTGGETISVSYPTEEMSFADKVMSLRGNAVPFCHATVFHELIPGHHLQLYVAERYDAHRQLFRTPFFVEGWALYWELKMWDLGFQRTPEERVGALFWRAHRCARIIFSLKFHLGQMTAKEAIEFLVDKVGHERRNATAEVRRSVNGSYGPLYQAAYLLGGLQLRALHRELVDSKKMTERQFHDAVLRQNSIPIDMVRAALTDVPLTPDYKPSWRFYGLPATQPAREMPAPPTTKPSGSTRLFRDHVEPHWLPGHAKFWYRNDGPNGTRDFVLVDADKGTRLPAFDHFKVATAIGNGAKADRLPVDELAFNDDGTIALRGRGGAWILDPKTYTLKPGGAVSESASLPATMRLHPTRRNGGATTLTFTNGLREPVEVDWIDTAGERHKYADVPPGGSWEAQTFEGHVWAAFGAGGKLIGVYEASRDAATASLGGPPTTAPARPDRPRRTGNAARPASPDGKWTAYVAGDNVYLRPRDGSAPVKLSDDGKPADTYDGTAFWWSADSKHLVALRTEPAQEHKVYEVESSPKDQVQPKLHAFDYLKPGDKIAHPRPRLFDVENRKAVEVKEDLFPNPWTIDDVRWAADASRFTFVYNQRGHQVLRVIAVDANTGDARAIVDERSKTFIDYSGKYFCRWVGEHELLWMSERDGWNHLWLYDADTGRAKGCATPGDFPIFDVVEVDEKARQVWFTAGGVRPGQDPYYTHFCHANFDGSGLVVLTEGDGTHKTQWSPGDATFIDTYSRIDLPPVTELRRTADGSLVCKLEDADAGEANLGRHPPERFTAKGRDGSTDIHGVIVYPRDFDPAKRYPVVENIYAGPQGFFTAKAFKANWGTQQAIADLGMIVVQCDGMGTSGRSKAFHDVCYKDLKDAGFTDRIAWIKAAARTRPQLDLTRVGIYGGSAGGQNALAALIWHHDFYKVAVADCGCHDNRMDKIWWNEQWMGWPVDESYAASSNAVNAAKMEGDLLLMVGELDTNVDPASTMQVVNALEKAGKVFDLVIVTGANHGSAETPYGSKRRAEFLARHLVAN